MHWQELSTTPSMNQSLTDWKLVEKHRTTRSSFLNIILRILKTFTAFKKKSLAWVYSFRFWYWLTNHRNGNSQISVLLGEIVHNVPQSFQFTYCTTVAVLLNTRAIVLEFDVRHFLLVNSILRRRFSNKTFWKTAYLSKFSFVVNLVKKSVFQSILRGLSRFSLEKHKW